MKPRSLPCPCAQQLRDAERGNIFAMLFAAVALTGVLASVGMQTLTGPVTTITRVTQRNIADTQLLMDSKIIINAAVTGAAGGDADSDGVIEPATMVAGAGAPTNGGFLPGSLGLTMTDPWGSRYGYCVWDHGTTNTSADRITGDNTATASQQPVIAVIAAGPDKAFQTACPTVTPGTVVAINRQGDDLVFKYTYAEASVNSNGLWTLNTTDQAKAELKDSGGTARVSIDRATGIGDFLGVMTDTIAAKTANITLDGGLKLDTDANVTACAAPADAGVVRYNGTTGRMEVCDGSAWKAAGTAEPAGASGDVQFNNGAGGLGADAALHWDNTNKRLGVGTSGPGAAVDIVGTTSQNQLRVTSLAAQGPYSVLFQDGGSTSAIGVPASASGFSHVGTNDFSLFNHATGFNLLLGTNGAERMRINSAGNVGIGTTSPQSPLHVIGAIRAYGDSSGLYLGNAANDRAWEEYITASGDLFFQSFDGTSWSEKLRFTSAGNVGIGTPSPASALHVVSATGMAIRAKAGGGGPSLFLENPSGAPYLQFTSGSILQESAGALALRAGANSGGTHTLYLQAGSANRVTVTPAGTVGIATTNPQAQLDVAGGIKVGADAVCNASKAGMVAWNASQFQICDGTTFKNVRALDALDDVGDVYLTESGNPEPGNNEVLAWNATDNRWEAKNINTVGSAIATPGGSDKQVQFNDGGALAGASQLYWDKTNSRLGIGTNAPAGLLDIKRASSDGGIILRLGDFGSGCTTCNFDFSRSATTGALTIQGNQTGFANIILAPTSGNVGIGTTSPTEILSVAPDTDVTAIIGRAKIGKVADAGSADWASFGHYDRWTAGGVALAQSSTGQTILNANTGQSINFRIGNADQMFLSATGNVGIGTTSPQSKLDVAGGVRPGADTTCSAAKAGMLAWNSNALQICLSSGSWATLSSSSGALSAGGSDTQLQFNDGGTLAGDTGLTWNKTGDTLRIGGTAPLNLNDSAYQYVADFGLSTAKGSYVEFLDVTPVNLTMSLFIQVMSWGYANTTEFYMVPVNYDDGGVADGTVRRLLPISTTGKRVSATTGWGSGEFALEWVKVSNAQYTLRIRQIGDTDQVVPVPYKILVTSVHNPATVKNVAGTDTTNYAYPIYRHTPLMAWRSSVGIMTANPVAMLDVAGGARVGADAVCSVAKAGMLAWNANTLQVCTDAGTFTNIATSAGLAGGGSGTPGGADTQVQFNDGGVFGGAAQMFWDKANNRLGVNVALPTQAIDVTGTITSNRMIFKTVTGAAAPVSGSTYWSSDGTNVWRMTGNVGIGTATPLTPLQVVSTTSASPRGILTAQFNDGADGAQLNFYKARGTQALPTSVLLNDVLMAHWAYGWNGTSYAQAAAIRALAEENYTSTATGTYLEFATTAPGMTGAGAKMVLTGSGNLGIGTTTPQSRLDVAGGARVGADAVCSVAKAGMLAWNSNTLQVCTDGGTFTNIASSSGGSLIPAGSDGSIQFKSGANLAADASNLHWDDTNNRLGIGTAIPSSPLHVADLSAANDTTAYSQRWSIGSDGTLGSLGLLIGGVPSATGSSRYGFIAAGDALAMRPLILNYNGAGAHGKVGIGTTNPQFTFHHASTGWTIGGFEGTRGALNVPAYSMSFRNNGVDIARLSALTGSANVGYGQFAFHTTGADGSLIERMRIDSSGNVGIGTAAPASKLSFGTLVDSAATDSGAIRLYESGVVRYGLGVTTGVLNINSRSDVAFNAGAVGSTAELVRIKENGNVGIGTVNPGFKLHVSGGYLGVSGQGTAQPVAMQIGRAEGTTEASIGIAHTAGAWAGGTAAGDLVLRTEGAARRIVLDTNGGAGTPALTLLPANGNVGIGTTSPGQKLAVAGTIRAGATSATSGTVLLVDNYSPGNLTGLGTEYSSGGPVLSYGLAPSTTASGAFVSSSGLASLGRSAISMSGDIRFYTGGAQTVAAGSAATTAEVMRITNAGNVGIGTTTPVTALHIKGAEAGIFLEETAGGANNEAYIVHYNNILAIQNRTSGGGSPVVPYSFDIRAPASTIYTTSSGNVGIGTGSPTLASLQIKGNAPVLALEGTDHAYQTWYPAGAAAGRKAWMGFGGAGATDFSLSNEYPTGALNFYTNATSRMYITAGGNVGIGTTGFVIGGKLNVLFNGASEQGIIIKNSANNSSGAAIRFIDSVNNYSIGGIFFANGGPISYTTTSDSRLKKDVVETHYGLADLMKVRATDYRLIANGQPGTGFIAQELYQIYPAAVTVGGDDPRKQPWAVDYGKLTPLLVKSVQELKAANDNLREDNRELEEMNAAILKRLDALEAHVMH